MTCKENHRAWCEVATRELPKDCLHNHLGSRVDVHVIQLAKIAMSSDWWGIFNLPGGLSS